MSAPSWLMMLALGLAASLLTGALTGRQSIPSATVVWRAVVVLTVWLVILGLGYRWLSD